MTRRWDRRQAIGAAGTAGLGALLAACGGGGDAAAPAGGGATANPAPASDLAGRFDSAAACSPAVELAEGPFYFDADAIRRDVREDRRGSPLRLGLRVRDAASCDPIENALVDLWHCDAAGRYSGFAAGGGEASDAPYLRGAQPTGRLGIAEFLTVYPGFYPGRTVHLHVKVHLDRRTLLTSQLFLPDAVTDAVHAADPYAAAGRRDVRNDDDGIFDPGLVMTVEPEGDGHLALMNIDVRRG